MWFTKKESPDKEIWQRQDNLNNRLQNQIDRLSSIVQAVTKVNLEIKEAMAALKKEIGQKEMFARRQKLIDAGEVITREFYPGECGYPSLRQESYCVVGWRAMPQVYKIGLIVNIENLFYEMVKLENYIGGLNIILEEVKVCKCPNDKTKPKK